MGDTQVSYQKRERYFENLYLSDPCTCYQSVMFNWKNAFPKRPGPPSAEQQEEDLSNCQGTDVLFKSRSMNIGAVKNTEADMDIKTIRELVQSNDLIQTNMQELQLSLEKLSDISVELQHMSEEVRQKAKETIN